MENKTIIYGASDDLIEVSGASSEEIGCSSDVPFYLGLSDGTLLHVEYDSDGEWRFRTKYKGSAFKEIIQAVGEEKQHKGYEKYSSYSDLVIFEGRIDWVTLAEQGKVGKL